MISEIFQKIIELKDSNEWLTKAVEFTPIALELLAAIWVLLYFTFEPIIPVYQGY